MPGTTAHYPSACREQPSGQVHAGAAPLPPPHRATLFARQGSVQSGSPGQPAARGSAGALLLFTHSHLRPRGRHRDCSLNVPQYTADELGPGPSPESRPVGPGAGHAGTWSPPPTRLHESPPGGKLSAPQPSAWFAPAGSTAFWEERSRPLSLPELRAVVCVCVCVCVSVCVFVRARIFFFFLIASRLLFSASPLPGAGMRSSRVEAAGGGAVRANWSPGLFDSRGNYRTQELARQLCRSWRGRVRHARKASRYNWLFPIALTSLGR